GVIVAGQRSWQQSQKALSYAGGPTGWQESPVVSGLESQAALLGCFLREEGGRFPFTSTSDSRSTASTLFGPFFCCSILARLCFSAAMRSVGAAIFRGFSTAVTSLPSRWALISVFRLSSKVSWYFPGSHS